MGAEGRKAAVDKLLEILVDALRDALYYTCWTGLPTILLCVIPITKMPLRRLPFSIRFALTYLLIPVALGFKIEPMHRIGSF